ncbi:NUDIX domain-containing protein [Chryseobacterium sp.]|uniref:NUDIX hydrolase n=1 Tax=Chryseobacterium sp. TaxID=1871047 RepID=UPI0025C48C39|nr:NUDIX domain-containing protein [Chryseobacterium sp.]
MKTSAGILLFRKEKTDLFIFLVHPGGPFWKNKDIGAWSIPKGEILPEEDPLERALIEFEEETGKTIQGNFIELSPIKQKGGKAVHAWAVEGELDPSQLSSNTTEIDWPPRSGKKLEIPEVDQWEWFIVDKAKEKINIAQVSLITELEKILQLKSI